MTKEHDGSKRKRASADSAMSIEEQNSTSAAEGFLHKRTRLGNNATKDLLRATLNNHKGQVVELLSSGVDPNLAKNRHNTTVLMHACCLEDSEIVTALLNHGAVVDERNDEGKTAFIFAAMNGHLSTARRLLSHGADASRRDSGGKNAAHFAAAGGHEEFVKFLVEEADIDIHSCQDNHGATPLMAAAKHCHSSIVKLLVEVYHVDVNAHHTIAGTTALILAAAQPKSSTVALLIRNAANVNAADRFNQTALLKACEAERWENAAILLEHNANVNVQDTSSGYTPLLYAAFKSEPRTVFHLLKRHADVNAQTIGKRQTALMWAAMNGCCSILDILVQHRANLEAVDVTRQTALMAAAVHGQVESVRTLLRHGASADVRNEDGHRAFDLTDNDEIKQLLSAFSSVRRYMKS